MYVWRMCAYTYTIIEYVGKYHSSSIIR